MKQIVVKSGVNQLPLFEREGYPYFEAYLEGSEHLSNLLKTPMKLLTIHMPARVNLHNLLLPFNFCDENDIGKASFQKLQELTMKHLGLLFCALTTMHQNIQSSVSYESTREFTTPIDWDAQIQDLDGKIKNLDYKISNLFKLNTEKQTESFNALEDKITQYQNATEQKLEELNTKIKAFMHHTPLTHPFLQNLL